MTIESDIRTVTWSAGIVAAYRADQERFRLQELARRKEERAAADLEDEELEEIQPVEEDQGGHA
mgnify:CR=1 FL=1